MDSRLRERQKREAKYLGNLIILGHFCYLWHIQSPSEMMEAVCPAVQPPLSSDASPIV